MTMYSNLNSANGLMGVVQPANGGTGVSNPTAHAIAVAEGSSAFNFVGPGTTGQVLQANSAADPTFSTATYPSTTTINQLLYSSTANVISGLATGNNGVLITSSGGVPSISSTLPSAVQGNITTTGTIGTGVWQGTPIALAYGGTNANLTASNGGIFYSTASAGAILSGTSTANQVLLSGSSTTPAWSTATYPATTTINQLLYSSASNTVTGLATAAAAVLTTSSSVPTWASSLSVALGGTGLTSAAAYSLICGGTTTTGNFQTIADVATGQVLISGGTSALPAFSAYPQVSGLGIGASPGSTAGLTFDGSNFLNNYATGTWTPTINGSSAGTTTYSTQQGYYTRIGNTVTAHCVLSITGATGTVNAIIGGLPIAINSQSNYFPTCVVYVNAASWTFSTGATCCVLLGVAGGTTANLYTYGSAHAAGQLQMSNAAATFIFTFVYQC